MIKEKMSEFLSINRIRTFCILIILLLSVSAQENDVCETCHDDEMMETVLYGIPKSLYVNSDHLIGTPHEDFDCIECHEDLDGVDDFPHNPRLPLPDCGSCHEDAQEEFIEGFFRPLAQKGYTSLPQCSDCHGRHKVSWKGEPRKVCGVCHQDILDEFYGSAHWNKELSTSELTCVSCHSPHNKQIRDEYSGADWRIHITETCRGCHEEKVVNYDQSSHYQQLLHGNPNAPVCSDCHDTHKVLSPRNPESKVSVARLDILCTSCHKGYEQSIHRPEVNDDPRLETCVVCHTGHETDMSGAAKGSIFNVNIDAVCLRCHRDNLVVGELEAHGEIHRNQVEKIDRGDVSDCGACHNYHFLAPDHAITSASKKECIQCHEDKNAEYEMSAHYIAWARGHDEAPTCVDCHNTERIQKVDEQFAGQSIVELCSRCHGDREFTMKFQLNADVVDGYNSSYHGQMYQLGYQGEKFATCVSCHDNHSILPSNNPRSTVGKEHIKETCSQCHDNVTDNFVGYLQHYSPHVKEENPILNIIHVSMLWLLGSVLFVFGTHTILWLTRLTLKRIKHGPIKKAPKTAYRVRRFGRIERFLHLGMILGFLTLASTGIPLKFSHSAAATWFVHNVIGFGTAAIAHRVGASLLALVFLTHLILLLYKAFIRGDKGIFWGSNSLIPNKQDAIDFVLHLAYFIGIKKHEPKFGRWTYWEKFDYIAVFWGMVVIGFSGLMLWFPEFFSRWVPGWFINAAHIVHSEEALLATAFIFTVHFFNTHLRPGAFPMDEVIFTGRMTEEQFQNERPLEYENLPEQEYKQRLTKPLPKWMKYLFFTAGYLFLTLGVVVLVIIIIGTFF